MVMNGLPWEAIAPFEDQAKTNHDQSLERLAQRAGVSPGEALMIMTRARWTVDGCEGYKGQDHCVARLMELVPSWVPYREEDCPGHVASDDPKVCARCGTHIDELRPPPQDDAT